jgi:hypothetical protein
MIDKPARRRRRGRHGVALTNRRGPGRRAASLRCRAAAAGRVLAIVAVMLVLAAIVLAADPVFAQPTPAPPPGAPTQPGVADLAEVVNRMRLWLMGLLFAVATFFFSVGFFRYVMADGDTSEIERAKRSFKYAAIGVAGAILAPLLVTILTGFVA